MTVLPTPPMSPPPVRPRPGLVKTLGILNITFAVILGAWVALSSLMSITLAVNSPSGQMTATVRAGDKAAAKSAGDIVEMYADPAMVRFAVVDLVTGLPLNILMLVTGIGLINAQPWAATWWRRAAWAKVVRLILVYGYFVAFVVPPLAAGMARMVVGIFAAQKLPPGKAPSLPQLTMVYGFIYGGMGVAIILLGIIYPLLSVWLLSRPGVRAVFAGRSTPPNEALGAT